jgi:hypothetical protein
MTTDFQRAIEDPQQPAAVDLPYPGEPLLVAFGGFAGKLGATPPFEFFRLTHRLRVNKAYLRDLDQCWYHAGLRGITRGVADTADFLSGLVEASRAPRTVVFGSSMGGYAALLFGSMVDATAIHAFSPHISLRDRRGVRHRDSLKALHTGFSDEHFDLNGVLGHPRATGARHVYFDSTDRKDRRQVGHLAAHARLHLHPYKGGGHNLVKHLRAAGELEKVVVASIQGVPYEPRTDIRLRPSLLDRLLGRKAA